MIKVYRNIDVYQKVSDNFRLSEFRCKCGKCHLTFIDDQLLILLEALRLAWGFPIIPTSGYRCQAHNRSLPNSSIYSAHQSGEAVDLLLPAADTDGFIKLCQSIFPNTYVGAGFIHCGLVRR